MVQVETNATRTRRRIVNAAIDLFLAHGYDGTTVEKVAQAAAVAPSTVYRYFPTKEDLGTGYLPEAHLVAELLDEHPLTEPDEIALGEALITFTRDTIDPLGRGDRVRLLIDDAPRLHGRLLEWLMEVGKGVSDTIAARRGLSPEDVGPAALGWSTMLVLERASGRPIPDNTVQLSDLVRAVIEELTAAGITGPRLKPTN